MNRFFLILLLLPFAASAQTALIFHKSHSGSAETFATTRFGNFGDPPHLQFEVIKLNDSVVVMKEGEGGTLRSDTLVNHPDFSNPALTVDSLTKMYNSYYITYIFTNFPEKPHYTPPPGQEHLPPLGIPDEGKKHRNKKHKREKHSHTEWVLLLIGGGTFFGTGLLLSSTRKRTFISLHA